MNARNEGKRERERRKRKVVRGSRESQSPLSRLCEKFLPVSPTEPKWRPAECGVAAGEDTYIYTFNSGTGQHNRGPRKKTQKYNSNVV